MECLLFLKGLKWVENEIKFLIKYVFDDGISEQMKIILLIMTKRKLNTYVHYCFSVFFVYIVYTSKFECKSLTRSVSNV